MMLWRFRRRRLICGASLTVVFMLLSLVLSPNSIINRPPLRPSSIRTTVNPAEDHHTSQLSLPPLSRLVNNGTIVGDVAFLLDFAIIGHCKTGTTFLANWLGSHLKVTDDLMGDERHYLTRQQPAKMVEYLYSLPDDKLRAFKAPRDVYNLQVVELLAKHFSTAKLIVGLRHPVPYFESFYNYRIAHGNYSMPPAELLLGKCMLDLPTEHDRRQRQSELGGFKDQGVCTEGAKFHLHLSYLDKTRSHENQSDYRDLLEEEPEWRQRPVVPNPVFVYESRQLSNRSNTAFRLDLQRYLELEQPLQEPAVDEVAANVYRHEFLDICQPKYQLLRQELTRIGRSAAEWIVRYFIDAPGVTISEPLEFAHLLSDWKDDPCVEKEVKDEATAEKLK